jgi:hypothetical protein
MELKNYTFQITKEKLRQGDYYSDMSSLIEVRSYHILNKNFTDSSQIMVWYCSATPDNALAFSLKTGITLTLCAY